MEPVEKFNCSRCEFSAKFDYFGKAPPFCKSITALEKVDVQLEIDIPVNKKKTFIQVLEASRDKERVLDDYCTGNIWIMEDAYVIKDPFADDQKCIILGSKCVACHQPVCVSQDCSLFYSKRFCIQCVRTDLDQFPLEIQTEIMKRKLVE